MIQVSGKSRSALHESSESFRSAIRSSLVVINSFLLHLLLTSVSYGSFRQGLLTRFDRARAPSYEFCTASSRIPRSSSTKLHANMDFCASTHSKLCIRQSKAERNPRHLLLPYRISSSRAQIALPCLLFTVLNKLDLHRITSFLDSQAHTLFAHPQRGFVPVHDRLHHPPSWPLARFSRP